MISRVFLFLVGIVSIFYQRPAGSATDCPFFGELMVESNSSLEASIIMSILTSVIQVNDVNHVSQTLTIEESELVSECLGSGESHECTCSASYMWTSDICYTHGCCTGVSCTFTTLPSITLCIAKVKVNIAGSIQMPIRLYGNEETKVQNAFSQLSGHEGVKFSTLSSNTAKFDMAISVKPTVSKFQEIATALQQNLGGNLTLKVEGFANMLSPSAPVHYKDNITFSCTLDMDTARENTVWHLSKNNRTTVLNNGSVVTLHNCTRHGTFCTVLELKEVTGDWTGTYECSFVIGIVMYTAKARIDVALLPDEITMEINPLTVDCAERSNVTITATIANTSETYDVSWTHSVSRLTDEKKTSSFGKIVYSTMANIKCDQTTTETQFVKITFINKVNQKKCEQYNVPVIYENSKFCSEDNAYGIWPKTPDGTTVTNRTCDANTVGYKSRTCKDSQWLPVYNSCVNKELSMVFSLAEDFEKGLGASQDMAKYVFERLKHNSNSETTESTANVLGVINVLDVMAKASNTFKITEEVIPNFVDSASNILNNDWEGVNDTVVHEMSSKYLQSVEGLVKNIKVNTTSTIGSANINVEVCSGSDCYMTVYGIHVNLSNSNTVVKTVGVKNLMNRLPDNYNGSGLGNKVVIVTQEEDSSDFKITLDFPNMEAISTQMCVYWDTNERQWSGEGCAVKTRTGDRTLCECNHLTAFSMLEFSIFWKHRAYGILVAKDDTPNRNLDATAPNYDLIVITYVGVAVSICSLIIFLIIECLVWSAVVNSKLLHYRHTAMVNIATFRLLADCSFLASNNPHILSDEWCLILTLCKHVFYLAMFSWMLCLSVMLVHQLIFVFSPLRKRVFFFFSSIVGYVCPIIIVGASYLFCKYTKTQYYRKDACWLVYGGLMQGSLYAFLLPVGIITLTNLLSMAVVIRTLMKTSVPGNNKTNDKDTAKSIVKVVLYLTPVFGITWAFGFILQISNTNDPVYPFANYIFTIFNTFQGLFILITGCFTEQKVREKLVALITCKKKANNTQNSDFKLTHTSQIKATDGVDTEDEPTCA